MTFARFDLELYFGQISKMAVTPWFSVSVIPTLRVVGLSVLTISSEVKKYLVIT